MTPFERLRQAAQAVVDAAGTDGWPVNLDRLRAALVLQCAACGHVQESHSSGGMCDGEDSECYCVRFPDAPDFAG